MEVPEIHVLNKVEWQFFGTLTFKRLKVPERVRTAMWFALARRVAKWHRVHFKRLIWCLRIEKGEIGERIHFHYLMAGLPVSAVNTKTCVAMMKQWERFGGGMARVRIFDPSSDGGAYITKELSGLNGADSYESAKFSHVSSSLMLSESCWRVAASSKRRTLAAQAHFRTDRSLDT